MYDVIARSAEKIESNGVLTIKRSELAARLGFNLRGDNAFPIMAKLDQFGKLFGMTKDGSVDRLLTVLAYDKETDLIKLYCGFLLVLHRSILKSSIRLEKTRGELREYKLPSHHFLWHASVANTQSETSFLLANELITIIMKAGRNNTASISYKKLIDRVPTLKDQISRQNATADKNKVLKRVFSGAFNLIETKSDAYKYFINLTIEPKIHPSTTTLSKTVRITHEGINQDYKEHRQ
jgi:hypothetical protein